MGATHAGAYMRTHTCLHTQAHMCPACTLIICPCTHVPPVRALNTRAHFHTRPAYACTRPTLSPKPHTLSPPTCNPEPRTAHPGRGRSRDKREKGGHEAKGDKVERQWDRAEREPDRPKERERDKDRGDRGDREQDMGLPPPASEMQRQARPARAERGMASSGGGGAEPGRRAHAGPPTRFLTGPRILGKALRRLVSRSVVSRRLRLGSGTAGPRHSRARPPRRARGQCAGGAR